MASGESLRPRVPEEQQDLDADAGARVEDDVPHAAGARRQKALVPLVETGHQRGPQHCDIPPAEGPLGISEGGQGFSPRAEQKNAEQAVAEDVSALAHVEVPVLEVLRIDMPNRKCSSGIEKAAGVVGGEICGRFDRDDDQPQDCGDPGF